MRAMHPAPRQLTATVCVSPSCVGVPARRPRIIAVPPSTEGGDLTLRLAANTSSTSFEVAAPMLTHHTSRAADALVRRAS